METRGKLTPEEASYLAGFIDADGCIGLYKKSPDKENWSTGYQAYLGLTNRDQKVLKWAQERIGGAINEKKRYQVHHSPAYSLQLRGLVSVLEALKQIEPYLITKREQANLVISFSKKVDKLTGEKKEKPKSKLSIEEIEKREKFFLRMKELNKRGVIAAAETK